MSASRCWWWSGYGSSATSESDLSSTISSVRLRPCWSTVLLWFSREKFYVLLFTCAVTRAWDSSLFFIPCILTDTIDMCSDPIMWKMKVAIDLWWHHDMSALGVVYPGWWYNLGWLVSLCFLGILEMLPFFPDGGMDVLRDVHPSVTLVGLLELPGVRQNNSTAFLWWRLH